MKKAFVFALVFLAASLSAAATPTPNSITAAVVPNPQTGGASIVVDWTPSVSTSVLTQNVYRANCTGTVTNSVCSTDSTATFSKLTAGTGLGPTIATFTDSTVSPGQAYIYYLTAVCPTTGACTGESSPSSHAAAAVPGVPPPPPTGVTIGTVTASVSGNSQTVIAKWTDTNSVGQYFAFTDGTKFLNQGLTSSPSGTFAEEVTTPTGSIITFLVCDASGSCASQKAM